MGDGGRYPLLLVTDDPDVLAVMPWVAGTIIHVRGVEHAQRLLAQRVTAGGGAAAGRGGAAGGARAGARPVVLAFGPDIAADPDTGAGSITHPHPGVVARAVVCTDEQLNRLTVGQLAGARVAEVWPVPLALDWLHERLGFSPDALYRSPPPPDSDEASWW